MSEAEHKVRMIQVTEHHEIKALRDHADDLGTPHCQIHNGAIWADADELRAWRDSQHTSGEADGS